MTIPSKAEQAAEGAAREEARAQQQIENGIDPGMASTEAEVPPEPIAETAPDTEGQIPAQSKPAPRSPNEPPKAPPRREMTPADRSRMEIAARFRRNRGGPENQGQEDDGSLEQAMRDELPPELAEAPPAAKREPAEDEEAEVEVDAASAQTPPPPPDPSPDPPVSKHKLKVRGQEVEFTQEEILAAARKTFAAEDYLDESRRRLDEVAELQRQLMAERAGQHPKPPGDATNTQTTDGSEDQTGDAEPPGNLRDVIETIQYGDPGEAAAKLEAAIEKAALRLSQTAIASNRNESELERSQRQLKEFQDQNAELAADTMARNAIQGRIMELQRDDLLNLGYKAENLPKDLSELANMHLAHRGQGHNVRQIGTLLTTARDDYVKWRGGPAQTQAPAPVPAQSQPQQQTTQNSAPKVAVNVDRTERRAVIPQQPKSSVMPRLEVPVQRSAGQNRQSAINKMINDRNRQRGSSITVG